ncbi:DUF438 domain-containing protein [candidate division WOR-3 bacterium]|nr:DUF438 domain-containing protein [candidate division WOR-3 bacterium]
MVLGPKTRIAELIRVFPFLEKFLPEYNPEFKKLLNPVFRNTLGKIATLEMAASDANISTEDFIQVLKDAIKNQTGEEVGVLDSKDLSERALRIKGILGDLHSQEGKNVEELKRRFAAEIKDISPSEIAEIEQQLISDGITEEDITRMCDLHVAVFRQSLDRQNSPGMQPGHPVHTFRSENTEFEKLARSLNFITSKLDKENFSTRRDELGRVLEKLSLLNVHYQRKENQLFPFLEKHGVKGPPQVMWNVHDRIRGQLKQLSTLLKGKKVEKFKEESSRLTGAVLDMIYKEEQILFPMALEKLDEAEWVEIKKGEPEIGYALIEPGNEWNSEDIGRSEEMSMTSSETGLHPLNDLPRLIAENLRLPLSVGELTLEQIDVMLKALPVDISFVDENDEVRYYSATDDRLFPRSPGVIGRKVQNCHPQKSVHIVEKILDEFRKGKKKSAEFWIQLQGRFIYIRYFALRDETGKYKGTLEVSQDISTIRHLEGEKRLLDWE